MVSYIIYIYIELDRILSFSKKFLVAQNCIKKDLEIYFSTRENNRDYEINSLVLRSTKQYLT